MRLWSTHLQLHPMTHADMRGKRNIRVCQRPSAAKNWAMFYFGIEVYCESGIDFCWESHYRFDHRGMSLPLSEPKSRFWWAGLKMAP